METVLLQNNIVLTPFGQHSALGADDLKALSDLMRFNNVVVHGFQFSFFNNTLLAGYTDRDSLRTQVAIIANNAGYNDLSYLQSVAERLTMDNPYFPATNDVCLLYRNMADLTRHNDNGFFVIPNFYSLPKDEALHIILRSDLPGIDFPNHDFQYSITLLYDIV